MTSTAYRARVAAALAAAGEEPVEGDPVVLPPALRGPAAPRIARPEPRADRLDAARGRRAAQLELPAEARQQRAADGLQALLAAGRCRRRVRVPAPAGAARAARRARVCGGAGGRPARPSRRARCGRRRGCWPARDRGRRGRRLEAGHSKAALAAAEAEHRTAIRAEQDAIREREALEASADVPARQAEVEALRAELLVAVREFREHRLAAALVQRTLRAFTEERQPSVLADASRLFARVTRRGYTQPGAGGRRRADRGDRPPRPRARRSAT